MTHKNMWGLVGIAWNLGYVIALPLIGFALGGRFVDKLLGSSPLFFLVGVLAATVLSTVLVYRKVSILIKDEEDDSRNSGTPKTPKERSHN